jgi:hypothetical protein
MGTRREHGPILGRETKVTISLLKKRKRVKPVAQTLTVGATAAAKGATAITVAALTGEIPEGQFLLFIDANGVERLCQLSADAAVGATTLAVTALAEAIPGGATAEFPVELFDRTAADISESFNLAEVYTLNTGGNKDGAITGSSKTISLPGIYYHYNAGAQTAAYAAGLGRELWLAVEYAPPNDSFIRGEINEGPFLLTGKNKASPQDNFLTFDMDGEFVGNPIVVPPQPVV